MESWTGFQLLRGDDAPCGLGLGEVLRLVSALGTFGVVEEPLSRSLLVSSVECVRALRRLSHPSFRHAAIDSHSRV